MIKNIEVHRKNEDTDASIELLKKRDAKLVKKAIGKQATTSLKAKSVKESIAGQNLNQGIELSKNQLETVQKSLGSLATERGLTKLPQRFRSRRLAKKIKHARSELN